MNRRSFFARMLGAACLAVAERVLPSSIAGTVKPMFSEQQWNSFRIYLPDPARRVRRPGYTYFAPCDATETFEQSAEACAAEHAETLRRLAD